MVHNYLSLYCRLVAFSKNYSLLMTLSCVPNILWISLKVYYFSVLLLKWLSLNIKESFSAFNPREVLDISSVGSSLFYDLSRLIGIENTFKGASDAAYLRQNHFKLRAVAGLKFNFVFLYKKRFAKRSACPSTLLLPSGQLIISPVSISINSMIALSPIWSLILIILQSIHRK